MRRIAKRGLREIERMGREEAVAEARNKDEKEEGEGEVKIRIEKEEGVRNKREGAEENVKIGRRAPTVLVTRAQYKYLASKQE